MGSGVPLGAGRELTLRFRLLAAAAGIVAVSLLLAGLLTWVMVRDLEFQSAQEQLDRQVLLAAVAVRQQECLVPTAATGKCRLDALNDYTARLNGIAPKFSGDRLLLLDSDRRVLYDSGSVGTMGQQVPITQSHHNANVFEARSTLNGQDYLAAAVKIPPARDPLYATYVVLVQPQSFVTSAATTELAQRLLEAGGAALILAMLLILLVSRSLTRPLTQLAEASEDIAGGNYSRRVAIKGQDEIGTLGTAFNRMAEAVERARKVQRDFLANVSHELKTPLTSLIGFSQALVDGSLLTDAERTRAATIIHEESERVLRMAQELLDLARVEAGSISIHIAPVDLKNQLEQEFEIVRPRAAARGLVLSLTVPDDIPPVAADPERLHQVLNNLVDNAVKYAPEGATVTATVRLSLGAVETVIANPVGTYRPDADRMFERFYRADASRSAAAGGVGLGLSISRELAQAMRGKLWADFNDAHDLCLHLLLPQSREAISKPKPPISAVA